MPAGHPLSEAEVTPALYAAATHVHLSRRDNGRGPIDDALTALRLKREIAAVVGGFSAALDQAQASDLVATVCERHTGSLYTGMRCVALPLPVAPFTVSLLWPTTGWRCNAALVAWVRARRLRRAAF